MYKKYLVLIFVTALILSGCETFPGPDPEALLTHPLGADPLKVGMTKDAVMDIWGEPDIINPVEGESEDILGPDLEEWVYKARYGNIPINKGYLSKDRRLYFDGNNLVKWEEGE